MCVHIWNFSIFLGKIKGLKRLRRDFARVAIRNSVERQTFDFLNLFGLLPTPNFGFLNTFGLLPAPNFGFLNPLGLSPILSFVVFSTVLAGYGLAYQLGIIAAIGNLFGKYFVFFVCFKLSQSYIF